MIANTKPAEWLAAMLEMETEGERTPAQEPREPEDDSHLPALVRRQAA